MTEQDNALLVFKEELGEFAVELIDLQGLITKTLELQKLCSKAMRFGIDEQHDLRKSNRERIQSEWNDLLGSVQILAKHGINLSPNLQAIAAKMQKIEKYANYSIEQGTVTANDVSKVETTNCELEMGVPIFKHEKFGGLFDRFQVQQYAVSNYKAIFNMLEPDKTIVKTEEHLFDKANSERFDYLLFKLKTNMGSDFRNKFNEFGLYGDKGKFIEHLDQEKLKDNWKK